MDGFWIALAEEDIDCDVVLCFWFSNQKLLLLLEEDDEIDDITMLFKLQSSSLKVSLINVVRNS